MSKTLIFCNFSLLKFSITFVTHLRNILLKNKKKNKKKIRIHSSFLLHTYIYIIPERYLSTIIFKYSPGGMQILHLNRLELYKSLNLITDAKNIHYLWKSSLFEKFIIFTFRI